MTEVNYIEELSNIYKKTQPLNDAFIALNQMMKAYIQYGVGEPLDLINLIEDLRHGREPLDAEFIQSKYSAWRGRKGAGPREFEPFI